MASNSKREAKIPLKLWVDKELNLVIMAETTGDFVDVLFSFLTLPLGTIIRVVSENQPHPPLEIGCINNLYHCVENSGTDVFWNHICKQMLLSPRNPFEAFCKRLKLKVDDSEPTKYFKCSWCSDSLLSTFAGARCSCGRLMDKEIKLKEESKEDGVGGNGVFVREEESKEDAIGENGVFVKGYAMYLIFDDLKVLQSSPGDSVQQLLQLGYKDFNEMTEVSVKVGMKEIFSILKQALTSKSPLSDVFLANGESKAMCSFSPYISPYGYKCSINLKITVSKSKNKILFAEAEGDFVDFLFSFLTLPLGSILNLMSDNLSSGCIENLYTSVKNLNPLLFIGSSRTSLLNPKVAPQFGCMSQPLYVSEEATPRYWYSCDFGHEMISKKKDMKQNPKAMKLFDPRSSDGARESAVGFVKRPCLFVVWDDLKVTPMASSSISFLQKLNVPLDDFEEHSVQVEYTREALNLLGASLTSKSALTGGLFYLVKKLEANERNNNNAYLRR